MFQVTLFVHVGFLLHLLKRSHLQERAKAASAKKEEEDRNKAKAEYRRFMLLLFVLKFAHSEGPRVGRPDEAVGRGGLADSIITS